MQIQVAPAALDLPNEGPVHAAPGGESFLAEALGFALGADSFAEGLGGWGDGLRHGLPNPIRPDCLRPEQLYPMCSRPGTVPTLR